MKVEEIEEMRVEYFYAHSFCSWKRGSNENNNRLIRRFIPKGMEMTGIIEKEVKQIDG